MAPLVVGMLAGKVDGSCSIGVVNHVEGFRHVRGQTGCDAGELLSLIGVLELCRLRARGVGLPGCAVDWVDHRAVDDGAERRPLGVGCSGWPADGAVAVACTRREAVAARFDSRESRASCTAIRPSVRAMLWSGRACSRRPGRRDSRARASQRSTCRASTLKLGGQGGCAGNRRRCDSRIEVFECSAEFSDCRL